LTEQAEQQSRDSEAQSPLKDDASWVTTTLKSDTSSPSEGDLVTAEVMFSEVRPETGHFEIIPSDSDEPNSSGSGTPVPHRIRLVREKDLQGGGRDLSSSIARPGSRSPMNVVEVSSVKSSEASQWRKEAMEGMCFVYVSAIGEWSIAIGVSVCLFVHIHISETTRSNCWWRWLSGRTSVFGRRTFPVLRPTRS